MFAQAQSMLRMARPALRLACLLAVLLACKTSEEKCSYSILVSYSFAASRNKNLSKMADFLSHTAGAELLPYYPECTDVTFSARPYLPDRQDVNHLGLRQQMLDGSVSFILASPLVQACLQDTDTVPMLSVSFDNDGALAQGTLVVREDSGIRSFADLRGKAIAVLTTASPIMFLLHAQRMAEMGLHVWADVKKVFVMGSQTTRVELLEQLREGKVDATFFTSEVTWSPEDGLEGMLNVCDGRARPLAESSVGMGCTKTRVDPVLMAAPTTPSRVRTTVMTALLKLTEDDEAAQQGGFKNFRSPDNYMANARLAEDWGILRDHEDGFRWCEMHPYEAITCPDGYQRKSPTVLQESCKEIGEPCDDIGDRGACICSPCELAFKVPSSFATLIHAHNSNGSKPCDKMATCFTVEHLSEQALRVHLRNPDEHDDLLSHNMTFKMDMFGLTEEYVGEGEGVLEKSVGANCRLRREGSGCEVFFNIPLPTGRVGNRLMAIYYNGRQIDVSPILYSVSPVKCETGSLRLPNKAGQCVCSIDSSVEIFGRCVMMKDYVPIIVVALAVLGVVAACVYIQDFKRRQDKIWRIEFGALEFDNPPLKLGAGTFGWVLAAKYRGTEVAVKFMIPRRNGRRTRNTGVDARSGSESAPTSGGDALGGMAARHFSVSCRLPSDSPSTPTAVDSPISLEGSIRPLRQPSSLNDLQAAPQSITSAQALGPRSPDPRSPCNSAAGAHRGSVVDDVLFPHDPLDDSTRGPQAGLTLARDFGGLPSFQTPDTQDGNVHGEDTSSEERSGESWGSGALSWLRRRMKHGRPSSWLLSDFKQEIRIMTKINHPNVVMIMGAVTNHYRLGPMLVMERMHFGSLENLLHNDTAFLEGDVVMHILRDIIQGMRFLHGATPPILHGDLKSANILVDADLRAKIADFGFSQKAKVSLALGSPAFMAPEVLRGEGISVHSDVYSFGVTLYELFSRSHPYSGERMSVVVDLVRNPREDTALKRPGIPEGCPQKIAELMTVCMAENPSSRPSFEKMHNETLRDLNVSNLQLGGMAWSILKRNKQSEEWLFDVFPKRIAEALIAGVKVEPEHKECVTIFFSDIVGFTSLSSEMEPGKVSDLLTRMHGMFDQLAKKHNVRKIETIGDAYIAVTNMEEESDAMHAANMARFACEVMQVMKHTSIDPDDASKGLVDLRIGIHTGPVVASVIGKQQPKFTLLGDAVNTASRMESTSVPGRIQCSKVAAKLIHEQDPTIRLVPRGSIAVKGKGMMSTFWVLQPSSHVFSRGSEEYVAFHKALVEPAEDNPDKMMSHLLRSCPPQAVKTSSVVAQRANAVINRVRRLSRTEEPRANGQASLSGESDGQAGLSGESNGKGLSRETIGSGIQGQTRSRESYVDPSGNASPVRPVAGPALLKKAMDRIHSHLAGGNSRGPASRKV